MVVFENSEDIDKLTLSTQDIEERPVTTGRTRSRYVTVLSVAGCLLTSLTIVTTVSVYWTLDTESLDKEQGESQFVLVQ